MRSRGDVFALLIGMSGPMPEHHPTKPFLPDATLVTYIGATDMIACRARACGNCVYDRFRPSARTFGGVVVNCGSDI